MCQKKSSSKCQNLKEIWLIVHRGGRTQQQSRNQEPTADLKPQFQYWGSSRRRWRPISRRFGCFSASPACSVSSPLGLSTLFQPDVGGVTAAKMRKLIEVNLRDPFLVCGSVCKCENGSLGSSTLLLGPLQSFFFNCKCRFRGKNKNL